MIPASSRHGLVGRSTSRTSLTESLLTYPTTVLVGPAGVGKTALALDVSSDEPWNSCVVSLVCARTIADAYRAIVGVLDPSVQLGVDPSVVIGRILRARGTTLLLLDNVEQLGKAGSELVRDLARELASAECSILVTSRRRVDLADSNHITLAPLRSASARGLFLARLDVSDRARYEAADATERIVARLDGLPLALELAAARAPLFDPPSLLSQIEESYEGLASRWQDRAPRHRSLVAAIDWSWRLLDAEERRTMVACALMADGFRSESVEALLKRASGAPPETTTLHVETLLNRSWIQRADEGFYILQTLREFAIAQEDPRCDLHVAHALIFAERAHSLALRADSDAQAYRDLIAARMDVSSALRWEAESSDPSIARLRRLLTGLKMLGLYQGPICAWTSALSICSSHFMKRDDDDGLWFRLETAIGEQMSGERGAALAMLQALEPRIEGRHNALALEVRQRLGHLLALSGRLEEAEEALLQTLAPEYEVPLRERGRSYAWLGIVAIQRGQGTAAREHLNKASRLFEEQGDRRSQDTQRHHLGMAYLVDGHCRDAERVFRSIIDSSREFSNNLSEACARANLGSALHFQHHYPEAREQYAGGAQRALEHGVDDLAGEIQLHAAILEVEEGDLVQALIRVEEARSGLAHSLRPERELSEVLRAVVLALEGSIQGALQIVQSLEQHENVLKDPVRWGSVRLAKLAVMAIASRQPVCAEDWSAQLMTTNRIPNKLLGRAVQAALVRRGLLAPLSEPTDELIVHREGHWFLVTGSARCSFGTRSPLRRLLKALLQARVARPGTPIDFTRLIVQVWPGEHVAPEAARNRLRVSVRKMRKSGLTDILLLQDGGYLLDPRIRVTVGP